MIRLPRIENCMELFSKVKKKMFKFFKNVKKYLFSFTTKLNKIKNIKRLQFIALIEFLLTLLSYHN